jgi:hypothetical protein
MRWNGVHTWHAHVAVFCLPLSLTAATASTHTPPSASSFAALSYDSTCQSFILAFSAESRRGIFSAASSSLNSLISCCCLVSCVEEARWRRRWWCFQWQGGDGVSAPYLLPAQWWENTVLWKPFRSYGSAFDRCSTWRIAQSSWSNSHRRRSEIPRSLCSQIFREILNLPLERFIACYHSCHKCHDFFLL